ncbi:MAG: (Fe-S)-binding protein [Marinifilaceae bacterium]|jgi:Fe-S oxidoreductase|nr:(Fe-S)-binding protein [Marinifilaceae bacterium]
MINIENKVEISIFSELKSKSLSVDYLLWVGCVGAYDKRYQQVVRSFVRILNLSQLSFAILGEEESCTGDAAKRLGNDFIFQTQALANISVFEKYEIKKIICICPHCYNSFKNDYPEMGLKAQVVSYIQILSEIVKSHQHIFDTNYFKNDSVCYHDPCYLGRANGIYDSPRNLLKFIFQDFREASDNKSKALCCGAGGGQFFKESEPGEIEISKLRYKQLSKTKSKYIATACPFCMLMLSDAIKKSDSKEQNIYDIAELLEMTLVNQSN